MYASDGQRQSLLTSFISEWHSLTGDANCNAKVPQQARMNMHGNGIYYSVRYEYLSAERCVLLAIGREREKSRQV